MLRNEGWHVNHKRVERIWRREGLRVPSKQPKRGRLWLNDGLCIRLRPEYKNHVWSYDFVYERTHDGRVLRILTLIDEYSRECLALRVERSFTSRKVLDTLAKLFIRRGTPDYLNEARVLVEMWRKEYYTIRPHSSLGYRPPAPEAVLPPELGVAV